MINGICRKRKVAYRFISLLLVLILVLGGCGKSNTGNETKNPEQLAEGENVQVSFSMFLDELFVSDLQDNLINLHYTVANPKDYGIEEYSLSLGDYEEETYKQSIEEIKETLKELKNFSYEDLTEEQQVIYDILKEYLEIQSTSGDYYLYEEPLAPTSGVQSQLPILLAEYIFRCDQDVEDYLGVLGTMKEYFESLIGFEKRKAEAGLFMNDTTLEEIVAQCKSFIETPENNLLISSFNERMEDYEAEESTKTAWKEQNRKVVLETVIPAYETLIQELETMKGQGKNEGGLCHFEKGKDYYEHLLQYYIGSNKSVDEMKKMIEEAEAEASEKIVEVVMEDPALFENFGNEKLSLEKPEEMLSDLSEKIQTDFPDGGSDSYEVKYVDECLEEYASPAFYLTPAVDDTSCNVIYINPFSEAEGLGLYTTLAHEGYPGHLYQETFYKETNPHPIRSIFYFGGYTEGWGIYAENYGYMYSDLTEGEKQLQQSNFIATLCLYSKIDIGIHYEGWDFEKTIENLAASGITDKEVIKEIYDYVVAEPGNYLKYFVGYLEIMELREAYKELAGEAYTDKDFHTFILEEGPMSFTLLNKRLGIKFPEEK